MSSRPAPPWHSNPMDCTARSVSRCTITWDEGQPHKKPERFQLSSSSKQRSSDLARIDRFLAPRDMAIACRNGSFVVARYEDEGHVSSKKRVRDRIGHLSLKVHVQHGSIEVFGCLDQVERIGDTCCGPHDLQTIRFERAEHVVDDKILIFDQ